MKKHTLSAILAAALLLLSACGGPAQTLDSSISSTQPQSQQEATTAQDLYDLAVQDAADAEESEILPLVTLVPGDDRVTWDSQGRVLLCTWHNYPDSYPPEDTVTIQWGPVWTFTYNEMGGHAEELGSSQDAELRLQQLIGFPPDSDHSTFTGFWVSPEMVQRPAYQVDPTDGTMTTAFEAGVDQDFRAWFQENAESSYTEDGYPWTRLGYTYDWADNGTEYGLTEFIVPTGAEVEVAFTLTTQQFLEHLIQMPVWPVDSASGQATLYIGTQADGFSEFPLAYEGDLTPDMLIEGITDLTGWDLSLAEPVTTGKGGMSVCLSEHSALFAGPPNPQKEEFFVYDAEQLTETILDSIQKTLQTNFTGAGGDPEALDIYYYLEGERPLELPDINRSWPIDQPYQW